VDAPGQPTFGEACDEWVFEFVRAIFGAYDADTGKRLIRDFFLLISKKNSKSTIAAGIMLTALIRNWRHSAELIVLAPTLEVANNCYKPMADMVRADETLLDLLHIQDNFRSITHRIKKAFVKVVAADTDSVGGKKASFVLVDELWIFGKREKSNSMLREATGGLVSRPEGFVIYLSTQSDEPPAGVFKEKLDYFRDVRDGKIIDPKSLGVLYEFPEALIKQEAYLDPAFFYVTNPNLDRSVSREWLLDELVKAKLGDAKGLNVHIAKHLNVEIGMNLRANRWPGAEHWEKGTDPVLAALFAAGPFDALDAMLDRCEIAVVGIDGGGLDDLFGITVLGREPNEFEVEFEFRGRLVVQRMKRWLSWSHAWCHEGVLLRRKSIASVLRDFEKAGEITIVGDELHDVGSILEIIKLVKERGLLAGVALDSAGISEFSDALIDDLAIPAEQLLAAGQGYKMMNAIKTTERRLAKGLLHHCGGKMMDWCIGNLKIEPTATAIRATKQNAGDAKIDPVMALFDAVTFMATNPQPMNQGSIYDDPAAYAKAFGETAAVDATTADDDGGAWKSAILADPQHPLFAEHRRRFDEWQATQEDD
jgi:phage terminase large subunit-like protein